MGVLNSIFSWMIKKRMHQIDLFVKYPHEVQQEWFARLIETAADTEWGQTHGYKDIRSVEDFRNRVPVQSYDDILPYILRLRKGEQNILWPGKIKWFAKSSGTTAGKSKFIPVSEETLEECHYKGGKDMLSMHYHNVPEADIFGGYNLAVGGSNQINNFSNNSYYGDLSAIILKNLPFWVEMRRTPNLSIALMDEWEEKIEQMARITADQDVRNIAGVPSWTLLLLNRILDLKNATDLREVWPNLELYVHGGVNFAPYRRAFEKIIPDKMYYLETYNASEGFFGIQDSYKQKDGMLLMLDYGIFYEFIPVERINKGEMVAIGLDEVETGVNYAMVISTNSGLWRYVIGDTLEFTSLSPYRIVVSGRIAQYINAFGEELIIQNVESALAVACDKCHASISEFTVAPMYMKDNKSGAHQWVIEFNTAPSDIAYFTEILDNALKAANSDYEAKRYHDMVLDKPLVTTVPKGSFYRWMKQRHQLGGQHKVPRLCNDRQYVDDLLSLIKEKQSQDVI